MNKLNNFDGDYELEEKDPNSMFVDSVHVGQCPLCGSNTYSENDPSDDPSMSVRCCKCTWWQNQFLTWEEMNNMVNAFKKCYENGVILEKRPEGEFKQLLKEDTDS